jgi:hypothetical protein
MDLSVTIELSDEIRSAVAEYAERSGLTLETIIARSIEKQFGPRVSDSRRGSFERHFGSWDYDNPFGSDNGLIEADLARALAEENS